MTTAEDVEDFGGHRENVAADPKEDEAAAHFEEFFEKNRESVYFSRQLEVQNEDDWFHWITNRALGRLVEKGLVKTEERLLTNGGKVKLLWHKAYRYYRRGANKLVQLVDEYANPNIGSAIGLHAELWCWKVLQKWNSLRGAATLGRIAESNGWEAAMIWISSSSGMASRTE
ncbi:MAG TPA: hypothetical protein VF004_00380 [Burkholderiales bacterium]